MYFFSGKLILKDPRLALSIVFGPCIPSQYRLTGRGAWSGARDAILTTSDRMVEPLKLSGLAQKNDPHMASYIPMILGLIMVVACLVLYVA